VRFSESTPSRRLCPRTAGADVEGPSRDRDAWQLGGFLAVVFGAHAPAGASDSLAPPSTSWSAPYNIAGSSGQPNSSGRLAMNNQMLMAVWRAGRTKSRRRRGLGYAASLGQRKRVAHIPAAEAEAAGSGLILEAQGQARLHLKTNDPSSHQWGPVHLLAARTSSGHSRISTADLAVGGKRPVARACGTESRAARWTMAGMSAWHSF
jgi:hypothetical protein